MSENKGFGTSKAFGTSSLGNAPNSAKNAHLDVRVPGRRSAAQVQAAFHVRWGGTRLDLDVFIRHPSQPLPSNCAIAWLTELFDPWPNYEDHQLSRFQLRDNSPPRQLLPLASLRDPRHLQGYQSDVRIASDHSPDTDPFVVIAAPSFDDSRLIPVAVVMLCDGTRPGAGRGPRAPNHNQSKQLREPR